MLSLIGRASRCQLRSIPMMQSLSRIQMSSNRVRLMSTNERPLILMDVPRVVYPNLFLTVKNLFSRMIISGYFDKTFTIQSFSEGARQAVTVVSKLIGNEQFEDLSTFATQEVSFFSK